MSGRMLAEGQAEAGRRVLVTGGAGYIGSVLVPRLVARGHRVRVLDRLERGRNPPAAAADGVDLVAADVRDSAAVAGALDGVDGVIALAGPATYAAAQRDPEASWQVHGLATELLGRECARRGIARVVFASSCCLYDGLPGGAHDEAGEVVPRGAYATAKRRGEEALLAAVDDGLRPVVLRNGTAYGWSPRMRFDLVLNTFARDALLEQRLTLHGGGWMRRPLVDVRDVADAMIAALEAPDELVGGEIFNVVHSNHTIREIALLVVRAANRLGRRVEVEDAPAPSPARDYACSGEKLASRLGFAPARPVGDAVADLMARLAADGYARTGTASEAIASISPAARSNSSSDSTGVPSKGRSR